MDRSGQQQAPQQRDMVFCHECENEWYRDEHGLTCPDCHSDFTEIIEPQHDPRDDLLPDDDDEEEEEELPALHDFHNHNPWAHQDNAPDPDEDDISEWRSNGPGSMTFQFTRNITHNTNQPLHGQQQDLAGNPLMQSFATMLNGMLGGRPPPGQEQIHNGQQQNRDAPGTGDAAQNQVQQANRGDGAEPGVHVYHGGGPGFAWTASTRVIHPRDANNAQPHGQPLTDLPNFLNQMFPAPAAGAARGGDPFANLGPLGGIFAGLLNPASMQHGDAVYSQEALDRIVSQLMEQNTSGNAPGPASTEAIARLPLKTIAESDLDEQGKADCSICMESVHIGENVTQLPCTHWFHGECIKAWLGEHDTCPHCRQGIMARDGAADAPRNADQPPRHDTNWGQIEGSQESSFAAPGSPTHERRSSSSSNRAGAGLFGRMRDAFGGGSSGP